MKKINYFIIFMLFGQLSLFSKIEFKVSGKAEYQGKGISQIIIHVFDITEKKINKKDQKTKTDVNGKFTFYLTNGEYSLRIERAHPTYVMKEYDLLKIKVSDKNISNILIELEKACSIVGKILFEDGTPVKGSIDIKRDHRSFARKHYDENGNFKISGVRAGENLKLVVSPDGMSETKEVEFDIAPGEVKEINVVLTKKISVQGKVFAGSENGIIKGLSIIIYGTNSGDMVTKIISTDTDSNGNFVLYNLNPGEYYIACFNDEGIPAINDFVKIILGIGEIKQIEIQLK